MCKKLFDSLIFNFFFFGASYAALSFASGGALLLGASLLSITEPNNPEYSHYATSSGFSIGLKSGLFFQWLTAGFTTVFVNLNMHNTIEKKCKHTFLANGMLALLSLTSFMLLHYLTLSYSVKNEEDCYTLRPSALENHPDKQNPLCNPSHDWTALFSAFYLGTSIFFTGCMLLYFLGLCIYHLRTTSLNTEPTTQDVTTPNVQNFIFEMAQISGR